MPALQLSRARLPATTTIDVMGAYGDTRPQAIAAERGLTVYLNKREIVTLMTLGDDPEALVVGYLRNQGLLRSVEDLTAVQVDWEVEAAVIVTRTCLMIWKRALARAPSQRAAARARCLVNCWSKLLSQRCLRHRWPNRRSINC